MEHPNALAYRRTADAFRERNSEALAGLIDEHVVWHVPGENPLAGEVHGREELFGFFDRLRELTDDTFTLREHDVLGTDDHVVAMSVMSAVRRGADRRERHQRLPLPGRAPTGTVVPSGGPCRVGQDAG